MSWWRKALGLKGPQAAASQPGAAMTPMSPELIKFFSQASAAGMVVNDDTAMKVSAVWACRRIIAECMGMISWTMHKKTSDRNSEVADDHFLQDVLVYSPNRDMTSVEFRETLTNDLTGRGNAFSLMDFLGKRVTSLYPMPASHVKVLRLGNGVVSNEASIREGEVFFRFNERGRMVDYPREKVWHVKGFGNGLEGLSPIGAAREAIGGALAMEEFANRFFSQGGSPAGTVTFPGWLTTEQRGVARQALNSLLGGLGKAHQFAMFEGGVKPEPWETPNMEDMQFVLGRKFSVLEICRIFRVPPHMVAELEKGASYASIEQMSMDFVMFTLMPYFTRFESSVTKWLLPPGEQRKYFLRFNYETLLRADSKGRAEFLSIMVNNGMMTRNEARAKENLNKSTDKNMDSFTVQTALAPIEKLGEQPKPQPGQPGQPGFPKKKDDEEETPAKQTGNALTIAVASPQDQFASILESFRRSAESQERLAAAVQTMTEQLSSSVQQSGEHNSQLFAEQISAVLVATERSAATVAEAVASQEERVTEALTSAVAGMNDAVGAAASTVADSNSKVSESLTRLANRKSEITIGGETFKLESKG